MKTKRVIAFITMLVMSVTVISQCFVTAFAQDSAEISSQSGQPENSGYNIFSIDIDGNVATVDFQAEGDCTLIVGIYDENDVSLCAVGTAEVGRGESEATLTVETAEMPSNYRLKGYLVDTETLAPLCAVYETQETQSTVTETVKIVSSVTLGDVNRDGMTDASDASQILGIYAIYSTGGTPTETAEQLLSADVNGDGMIDASDASTVLAYYAYLSTGGTVDIETFMST